MTGEDGLRIALQRDRFEIVIAVRRQIHIVTGVCVKPISKEEALDYHFGARPGKIEIKPTKACVTQRDLSLAYTPGVAEPCLQIKENPLDAFK